MALDPSTLYFARENLLSYAGVMNPSYLAPDHLVNLAAHLEAVERGEIKRLIITMPPRHGKSELTSVNFPAWFLGRNPEKFVIFTTYAQDFAMDFGSKVKDHLMDPYYQEIFPETRLRQDFRGKKSFKTTKKGVYYAVSIGGAVTGRGAHVFLIDDPFKNRKDAESATYRANVTDFFKAVAFNRLEPGGAIIIIMTRWHQDDLVGWIHQNFNDKWTTLDLPAISDSGLALWPERYPIDRLRELEEVMGDYEFSALFQQKPVKRGGNILQREWWNYYERLPLKIDRWIQSWDLAFRKGQETDFVVGQVWAKSGANAFLVHQVRQRMSFTETLEMFKTVTAQYPQATTKVVEAKANGDALIDMVKNKIPGVVPFPADTDKIARATSVSYYPRAGNVYLPDPKEKSWCYKFVDECANFPKVDHDDQVDAFSQALLELFGASTDRLRKLLQD